MAKKVCLPPKLSAELTTLALRAEAASKDQSSIHAFRRALDKEIQASPNRAALERELIGLVMGWTPQSISKAELDYYPLCAECARGAFVLARVLQ